MQKKFLLVLNLILTLLLALPALANKCSALFNEATLTYEAHIIQEAMKGDGHLRVNLGGIGEVPHAVNINILIDPRHASMKIPNLIKSDMREMPFLQSSTVDQMFCFACPGARDFFDQVTLEALRVLKVGGTFQITSNSSAVPWIAALNKYGFIIERYTDKSVIARKVSEDMP